MKSFILFAVVFNGGWYTTKTASCTNDGNEAQNITDMDVTVSPFEEPHIVEEVSMEDDDPDDYNTDTEDQYVLTCEIIEDSSIRGKTKLYSSVDYSYTFKAKYGKRIKFHYYFCFRNFIYFNWLNYMDEI